MKDLLTKSLSEASELLNKRVPKEKTEIVSTDISEVAPNKLLEFMKEKNIPENAYFSTNQEDTYAVGNSYVPMLCHEIKVRTSEKEQLKYKRDKFSSIAFPIVYKALTENGYKRKGFNSGLLAEFKNTTLYDMYVNKEFERIIKYYSLSFTQTTL